MEVLGVDKDKDTERSDKNTERSAKKKNHKKDAVQEDVEQIVESSNLNDKHRLFSFITSETLMLQRRIRKHME